MGIITTAISKGDYCVWWRRTGTTSAGQAAYAAPVELKCRWDDMAEEFVDSEGTTRISKAMVMVPQDLAPGDVLWHGRLANAPTLTKPKVGQGTLVIRGWERIPDFNNREIFRRAML